MTTRREDATVTLRCAKNGARRPTDGTLRREGATNSPALTERLRAAAQVSDGGIVQKDQPPTKPNLSPAMQSEAEIIVELTEALETLMENPPPPTPPSVPLRYRDAQPGEGQREGPAGLAAAPAPQPVYPQSPPVMPAPAYAPYHRPIQTPSMTAPVPLPTLAAPGDVAQGMPQPAAADSMPDEGDIDAWLRRQTAPPEEPRRRGRTLALGVGTVVLSVLVGYGGAQFAGDWLDGGPGGREFSITRGGAGSEPGFFASLGLGSSGGTEARQSQGTTQTAALGSDAAAQSAAAFLRDMLNNEEAQEPGENSAASGAVKTKQFVLTVPTPEPAAHAASVDNLPPDDDSVPPGELEAASTPAPAAKQKPVVALSTAELDRLFERVDGLLDLKDVASARLILRHMSRAGSGVAARRLAETYDPDWLAQTGTRGVKPDAKQALVWYRTAAKMGETDVGGRMAELKSLVPEAE